MASLGSALAFHFMSYLAKKPSFFTSIFGFLANLNFYFFSSSAYGAVSGSPPPAPRLCEIPLIGREARSRTGVPRSPQRRGLERSRKKRTPPKITREIHFHPSQPSSCKYSWPKGLFFNEKGPKNNSPSP